MTREAEILEKEEGGFEDNFREDLESWFSADIACCTNCVDDFLSYWPLADEANDFAFQKSYIDMNTFYSGSRLQQCYSKEEFDILIQTIHCDRCNEPLKHEIWVYDLPFLGGVNVYDFECRIEELTILSLKTPFLLLKNEFALQVYDVLHELINDTKVLQIEEPLYRARASTEVKSLYYNEFKTAPKEKIGEGRYNHAAEQVLYLSSDKKTCFNELNQQLCYVAECNITKPIKVLDLTEPYDAHQKYEDILNALIFSALMSKRISTTGYNKPAYVFSRFIADCAKSANFDAIKYPSTKAIDNNYNLVVLNEEIFTNYIKYINMYFYDGSKEINLKITV